MKTMQMDDKEMLNRRARLRELIAARFDNKDENLLSYIEHRTGKRPNQGELSAIQKDNGGKSFGDKKAKSLAEQIGLNRRWFDFPIGSNLIRDDWLSGIPEDQHDAPSVVVNQSTLTTDELTLISNLRAIPATDAMRFKEQISRFTMLHKASMHAETIKRAGTSSNGSSA